MSLRPANLHSKTLSRTKQNLASQLLWVLRDFHPDGWASLFKAYGGAELQSKGLGEAKLHGVLEARKRRSACGPSKYNPSDPTTFHQAVLVNGITRIH